MNLEQDDNFNPQISVNESEKLFTSNITLKLKEKKNFPGVNGHFSERHACLPSSDAIGLRRWFQL